MSACDWTCRRGVVADERWARFTLDLPVPYADWVTAELVDWGSPGVEISEGSTLTGGIRLLIYFGMDRVTEGREKLTDFLERLGEQARPYQLGALEEVEPADWAEGWRFSFPPIPVGERLLIIPPWEDPEPDDRRIPIYLQPGMAFGTGQHPSTILVLECMERLVQLGHGPVLDIGCGSGILAVAAVRLGAERVLAVDYDRDAVASAIRNVERNDLSDRIDVSRSRFPNIAERGPFPLVLANVYYTFFRQHAAELAALLPRGGIVLASGLQDHEGAPAAELLEGQGLDTAIAQRRDGWCVLEATRP